MGDQSGVMPMPTLGFRVQGELIQLRLTLKQNKADYELQSKELASVRQELEALQDKQGLKNLQTRAVKLKQEKEFLVTDADKLKKEFDTSRERREYDDYVATSSSSEVDIGGWFGFGGNIGESEEKDTNADETSGEDQVTPNKGMHKDLQEDYNVLFAKYMRRTRRTKRHTISTPGQSEAS